LAGLVLYDSDDINLGNGIEFLIPPSLQLRSIRSASSSPSSTSHYLSSVPPVALHDVQSTPILEATAATIYPMDGGGGTYTSITLIAKKWINCAGKS
jgi:hypothetical protein